MTMLESESVSGGGDGAAAAADGLHILQGRSAATLGLGWLIAITLCGGVSLFICVGFALAWHAQKRRTPLTITRTTASLPYEASGFTALLSGKPSTTRLMKRRTMLAPPRFPDDDTVEDDDDDKTTLASRFSLKRIPSVPMLPPLPSYSTFRLWNPKRASYRRERGWLDEEAVAIGGQMLVSVRQRPGSGSGWAGQHPPVLPPVGHRSMRQGLKSMAQGKQQPKQQQQQPPAPPRHLEDVKQQPTTTDYDYVYDKHDQPHQPQQQTEEELVMPAMPGAVHDGESGATEDFVRPAAAVLARHPTRTDSELRDILRSTEQRLRDGDRSRSRSPEKRTPHGSPTKTSTPRSTPGGRGATRQGVHHNGSPVKYGGVTCSVSGSGGMGAREGSAASIGSAANSLIAHATEELQLPGGMGSPSRLRGHEWLAGDDAILQLTTPQMQQQQQRDGMERALQQQYLQQQQQQQQQNASPQRSSPQRDRSQRRRSTDSDASSSLSTLYSVGDEVDDASIQAVVEGPDDPFVDRRGIPVLAPLRRTMTVSSETLSRHVDHSAMPSVHHQSPPLRNPQRLQQGHQTHKSLDAQRFAGALQPPSQQQQQRGTEDVRPKSAMYAGYTSPLVSESSFTDMSVDSTTLSASSEDTITADDDEGFDVMATTPVRRRGSDASSSPFSEHDIVNMIIAAQSPKKSKNARALPTPPGLPTVVAPDGSIIPTALSPPPKSLARTLSLQRGTSLVRKASVTSSAYSNTNNNNDHTLTASRSGGGAGVNGLSVSNTVAELRRMNSLVSNTSNNSLTSAAASAVTETPVLLPNLSDGRLPQLQSVRNAPRMGTKQYLNVGGSSSSASGKKSSIGKPGGPRPKKGGGHVRAHTTTTVAVAVTSSTTPERPAKDPRRSLGNVGSLVERYQKREVVVTAAEKGLDNGKENAGLGISRAPSTRQAAALQESSRRRRGGTPTKESSPSAPSPSHAGTGNKKKNVLLKNPVVAELAAAEQRRHSKDKRGSVDSLGLYDQDGFLLPSPERELTKKLLRM